MTATPTGDGYGSQGAVPVHFGLADAAPVTVEVTFVTPDGRVRKRLDDIDPRAWTRRAFPVGAE